MNRTSWLLFSTLMFLTMVPSTPQAAVPDFVTYSGRLTDGTGWGQSDSVALTFRIYAQAEGGASLWEQAFPGAAIQDGYFSVILTGVADVFGVHDQTWVTVCVGEGCTPEDELLPRQAVGSVPYAMRAHKAEQADDFNVAGAVTIGKSIRNGGLTTITKSLDNLGGNETKTVGTIAQGLNANYMRVVAFGGHSVPSYVEKIYQAYNSEGSNATPTVTTVTQYGFLDVTFTFLYFDGQYLVTIKVVNISPSPAYGYTTSVIIEAFGAVAIDMD